MEEEKGGGEEAPLSSRQALSSSSRPSIAILNIAPLPHHPLCPPALISFLRDVIPRDLLLLSVATNRGGHVPG